MCIWGQRGMDSQWCHVLRPGFTPPPLYYPLAKANCLDLSSAWTYRFLMRIIQWGRSTQWSQGRAAFCQGKTRRILCKLVLICLNCWIILKWDVCRRDRKVSKEVIRNTEPQWQIFVECTVSCIFMVCKNTSDNLEKKPILLMVKGRIVGSHLFASWTWWQYTWQHIQDTVCYRPHMTFTFWR